MIVAVKEVPKIDTVIPFFREDTIQSDMFFRRFIAYDATKYYHFY